MAKISIEWLWDTNDCETCGTNYAEGARVRVDGQVAFELTPVASCMGGSHYDTDAVFARVLDHLGQTLEEG